SSKGGKYTNCTCLIFQVKTRVIRILLALSLCQGYYRLPRHSQELRTLQGLSCTISKYYKFDLSTINNEQPAII
ncbi:hypothetical protein, partial [Pontibacter qinzhouensis]|uniref:hypothetical protein n=1 Tax=Pontibacter qinzhouensis TaxID=2603253 RepID=UPI001C9BCDC2